jgi:hypothetical protein
MLLRILMSTCFLYFGLAGAVGVEFAHATACLDEYSEPVPCPSPPGDPYERVCAGPSFYGDCADTRATACYDVWSTVWDPSLSTCALLGYTLAPEQGLWCANAGCSVHPAVPASCEFNGSPVSHGASVTAYVSNAVTEPDVCTSETRTCNNGVLSGSYVYPACTVSFSPAGSIH